MCAEDFEANSVTLQSPTRSVAEGQPQIIKNSSQKNGGVFFYLTDFEEKTRQNYGYECLDYYEFN